MTSSFWTRRRAELRHGVRITAAGLASFGLAKALVLPQGYWAVFTAVLVVQSSVGGSLKATIDRLIGTIGGALYGAAVATLVPHDTPPMLFLALALSLTPLAFAAALNASFRVAPVTAVILLLGNVAATESPAAAAFFRTLEVGLGGTVGLVISLIVLPAKGHAVVCRIAETLATRLAWLAEELFRRLASPGARRSLSQTHDAIQAAFDQLEAATLEANRERRTLLADEIDPSPIPRTLRRVYHDLVLISRVADEPLAEPNRLALQDVLLRLGAASASFLREVGEAFAAGQPAPSLAAFHTAAAEAFAGIAATAAGGRLVALAFALEQLQRNFSDLARRADEFSSPQPLET